MWYFLQFIGIIEFAFQIHEELSYLYCFELKNMKINIFSIQYIQLMSLQ